MLAESDFVTLTHALVLASVTFVMWSVERRVNRRLGAIEKRLAELEAAGAEVVE